MILKWMIGGFGGACCVNKRGTLKGNTSNLWSHLAKSKDEQHIKAHNSIKDKCQPPRKKTMTADNVPERLMDHETDVENDEREDSNPVSSSGGNTR